ncbi:protein lethal(2)essential for life-like [Malaya genurostris]|uniref:protein lethal(2)essential for life-like n=1 Tax=Malaya genurostris TaxID=325434 RepID=UPI0026F3EE85|nr:protein lethal(2)essential for life-like [Malaya genurostris]
MSLLPILFRSWCDDFVDVQPKPSTIQEKYFGEDSFPEDLMQAIDRVPKRRGLKRSRYMADEVQDDLAAVMNDKGGFQVSVDVQQFTPEEISVKMVDDYLTVEGKHEEKQDEHGFVSRHFIRKYRLPEGHDAAKVVSSLSSDGVLTIKAPKMDPIEPKTERSIPIIQTRKPNKKVKRRS